MQPQDYLDRLSTHLKNTIARAIGTATAMGHSEVTPLHLFFALTEESGAVANDILSKLSIPTGEELRGFLTDYQQKKEEKKEVTITLPELNEKAKGALEKAMLLAYEEEHPFIGTEHLLYGLVNVEDTSITAIMVAGDIDPEAIHTEIEAVIDTVNRFPNIVDLSETIEDMQSMMEEHMPRPTPPPANLSLGKKGKKKKNSVIDIYTIELTEKDRQKKIDPVIGRDTEVGRMINILARRTKNNPVLVGEPGVGKTAIVEGLAKRIAEGDVPPILRNKRIYALDLTLLISGTIYRGEFESRIKHIIDEFAGNEETILFIDEIHTIIGAGSNQGTLDAANILKPALARGELHCIGATTLDEYQKHIIQDPALARRFQSIHVKEPSIEQAKQILSGIATYYESFHGVTIPQDTVDTAVTLSTKYIHDNFLPDKAIDLLDEAAAAVKVARGLSPEEMALAALKEKKEQLITKKELAIAEEQLDEAVALKEEINTLETALTQKEKELTQAKETEEKRPVLPIDVAKVLSARIGQPAARILADEWSRMSTLKEDLQKSILGQYAILDEIVTTLKKGYLDITAGNQPIASFLFTGPSGTGKTALAKALAEALYDESDALVKLDMTEFSEAHGVSKLLGSPAGYVGYNERNKFFEAVKNRPYSIVLFDEFDKAHPDVRKLLLQILEEGMLTDSTGKKISFKHTIIILTANSGAEIFTSPGIGFGGSEEGEATREKKIRAELAEQFGNTLLSRIDHIGVFAPLSEETLQQIIAQHVATLSQALQTSRDMAIDISEETIAKLLQETYQKNLGIRHMQRSIDRIIQNLVIEKITQKTRKKTYTLTATKSHYKLI